MGATASALWGSSVSGVPPSAMHGLRLAAAHCAGRHPKGASLGIRLHSFRLGTIRDPLVAYTGHVMFQWATAVWDGYPKTHILEATMASAISRAANKRYPWRGAASPADVAYLSLARIG